MQTASELDRGAAHPDRWSISGQLHQIGSFEGLPLLNTPHRRMQIGQRDAAGGDPIPSRDDGNRPDEPWTALRPRLDGHGDLDIQGRGIFSSAGQHHRPGQRDRSGVGGRLEGDREFLVDGPKP